MSLVQRNTYRFFATALLALSAENSALTAESYLKIVPASAMVFAAVNHMSESSDKIQKLAKIMQISPLNTLDEGKKAFGVSKGLDESGAVGMIAMAGKNEKDTLPSVVFIAVSDKKEFLSNFEVVKAGDPISEVKLKAGSDGAPRATTSICCIAFRSGYALTCYQNERAGLEALLDSKQDISAEMAGLETWLAENDGVFAVTKAGIQMACKAAIEESKKSSENSGIPTDPTMPPMASNLVSFMQLASNLSLFAQGVSYDKRGSLHYDARARIVNGGTISKAIAAMPPVRQKLFSDLPGGPFVVAAGGVALPGLTEECVGLLKDAVKNLKSSGAAPDEELDRLVKQATEAFRQVHSLSLIMKAAKRDEPISSNIFAAWGVDDAEKLLDLQEKNTEIVNKLLKNSHQDVLKSIFAQRVEIAGHRALQHELNFDLSSVAGAGNDHDMLDTLIGPGGKMLIYHVAANEHTVLTGIGVPQDRMATNLELLKQPKRSLAEDAEVAVTAEMLPADSQWAMYISLRGCVQLTQRIMAMSMKNAPGLAGFSLPDFPKAPPIGIAVRATPAELRGEIVVPSALVEATGNYVKEVQNIFVNRMMQPKPAVP